MSIEHEYESKGLVVCVCECVCVCARERNGHCNRVIVVHCNDKFKFRRLRCSLMQCHVNRHAVVTVTRGQITASSTPSDIGDRTDALPSSKMLTVQHWYMSKQLVADLAAPLTAPVRRHQCVVTVVMTTPTFDRHRSALSVSVMVVMW